MNTKSISLLLLLSGLFLFAGCDSGLEPPDIETDPVGVINGTVTYSGEWPPADSLHDLRFVALKSIPQSATDIVSDFQNLPFSGTLDFNVEQDTFTVENIKKGVYVYNVIAQQYGDNILQDWRPVGLYEETDGLITVNDDTVSIAIHVNFDNLPPFPPE